MRRWRGKPAATRFSAASKAWRTFRLGQHAIFLLTDSAQGSSLYWRGGGPKNGGPVCDAGRDTCGKDRNLSRSCTKIRKLATYLEARSAFCARRSLLNRNGLPIFVSRLCKSAVHPPFGQVFLYSLLKTQWTRNVTFRLVYKLMKTRYLFLP